MDMEKKHITPPFWPVGCAVRNLSRWHPSTCLCGPIAQNRNDIKAAAWIESTYDHHSYIVVHAYQRLMVLST
eukprot:scaffold93678_cov43-Prasinocladus_malaysianus.AAC.1